MRIIAAVCIAFTHSFNLIAKNTAEPLMVISGQRYDFSFIGLCIFFSISGYLITRSACTSTSFINYCWKRFLRIQPLLIIVTLISIFIIGPLFTRLAMGEYFGNISTWTYLRNIFPATGVQFPLPGVFAGNTDSGVNGSLWTLVIEERLYLLVSILFFLKGNKKRIFISGILLLNLLYILHSTIFQHGLFAYFETPEAFFAFLFLNAGMLFLLDIKFSQPAIKRLLVVIPVLAVSLIFTPLFFLQVWAVPLFIIGIANIRGITNRAGQWGDFTYGIYIFAFPVQQVLIAVGADKANPYWLFAETMLIVLPLAILSWHLVEKKFLKMKKLVG
ncbi:acyltransferase [Ferruginibacter sp. HRS2-29]|uniref:acyltransferase family protein n=1 Tax=Ferruginibacter sp. HRS2-29 TaxID=2487334 RepID=UPI0020CE0D17|nr:acyltransferase [Ferruginibacter sp. HRS2-29]